MPEKKTLEELLSNVENFGAEHPTYWGCALAGEAGEVANILKKVERDGWGNGVTFTDLGEELVDTLIYIHLTADTYGIDLHKALERKLEILKKRKTDKGHIHDYWCDDPCPIKGI